MNIRSIVGLTAFSPVIIASVMSLAVGCAPKSRYRGPVNIKPATGGLLDRLAAEKAAQEQLEQQRKKYQQEQAQQPDVKAASDALKAQIKSAFATVNATTDNKISVVLDLVLVVDGAEKQAKFSAGFDSAGTPKDLSKTEGDDLGLKVSAQVTDEATASITLSNDKKGNVVLEITKPLSGSQDVAVGEIRGELTAEDLLSVKELLSQSRVMSEQTVVEIASNVEGEKNTPLSRQTEIISMNKDENGKEVRAEKSIILSGNLEAQQTLTVISGDGIQSAVVALIDTVKNEITITLSNGEKSIDMILGRKTVAASTTTTSTSSTTTLEENTTPTDASSTTTTLEEKKRSNVTRTGEIFDAGSDQDDVDYN